MVIIRGSLKPSKLVQGMVAFVASLFFAIFALAGEAKSEAYVHAETLMKSENYKSAAKIITKAQEGGEDTIEMSLLLTEIYAGRVDQVGAMSKLGIAKKNQSFYGAFFATCTE